MFIPMKYIEIGLADTTIHRNEEICGTITVRFPGRYDGVMINTQILNTNEHIHYTSYNDKKISQNVARLFVSRDHMPENVVRFTALIDFETEEKREVKIRVSIIEQHKEVASDIIFAEYL